MMRAADPMAGCSTRAGSETASWRRFRQCFRWRLRWRRIASLTCAACLSMASMIAAFAVVPGEANAAAECKAGVTNYVTDRPWTDDLLGLTRLAGVSQGEGVTVAVVDSGVSTNNPHLKDAVDHGVDLTEGGKGGKSGSGDGTTDHYGHGTAVAGIIAARRIDGSSLQGVAPKARILPVRVFDALDSANGSGGPSLDTLAAGIRYAADHHAQIINVSMSNLSSSNALVSAVDYATDHGSLVVASAGNRSTSSSTQDGLRYPAAFDNVLGVAASDDSGHASADSIRGAQVDVLAPGMSVLTTVPDGVDCVFATDAASSSFATAYASGVAALVASAHPDETPAQWKLRIEQTGNRANPDERDDARGWGMIAPYDAVTTALGDGMRGPGTSMYKPYRATSGTTVVLSPQASEDPDRLTKTIVAAVGVGAAIVTILCLAFGRTRRLRAERGARVESSDHDGAAA